MRAAILRQSGGAPVVDDFDEPVPQDGQEVVDVAVAGVNPVDLALASGQMGEPEVPSVVGQEGVGRLSDGRRVYFNPAVSPYGSFAERALVEPEQAFDVPDTLSDELAVTMGIAGLAAWLALEHQANVQAGDQVLVLGATGVVGRIAVQAARVLGAGAVVAAARDADALAAVGADRTVTLGGEDDAAALREGAADGFDVVIDPLYGTPFEAALGATADGARLVTIGQSAGPDARIPFRVLQGRTHIGHANNTTPLSIRRLAYETLTAHAAAGRIQVEVECFPLERAPKAWDAQANSPRHKLLVVP